MLLVNKVLSCRSSCIEVDILVYTPVNGKIFYLFFSKTDRIRVRVHYFGKYHYKNMKKINEIKL